MEKIIDLLTRISVLYNIPQWAVDSGALAIFVFLIAAPFIAKKLMEPKYYKFREMFMYNILWKWKYRKGEISLLWCYCPHCQGMLTCDDENCRSTEDLQNKITFFVCNECGGNEQGRVVGGDRRYVQSLVKREIWRQIRSLDYIETMKKIKEDKDALLNVENVVEDVISEETVTEKSTEELSSEITSTEIIESAIEDTCPNKEKIPTEQGDEKHGI
ncbi:MAG: hypothetical protein PHN18_06090 [Sulfurospirillaceae bacterium]|nr:hypothetical protein [Sulfurospirillaceae bacterium]MDD2825883.1 hypothetical protein [Sulfurospirillaceae bacterium]